MSKTFKDVLTLESYPSKDTLLQVHEFKVHAEFRCEDEHGVVGTTSIPVHSVRWNDDDSITVTLDYWPPQDSKKAV